MNEGMHEGVRDIRPQLALPKQGLPLPVLGGMLAALALGLFVALERHRLAPEAKAAPMQERVAPVPELPALPQADEPEARPEPAPSMVAYAEPLRLYPPASPRVAPWQPTRQTSGQIALEDTPAPANSYMPTPPATRPMPVARASMGAAVPFNGGALAIDLTGGAALRGQGTSNEDEPVRATLMTGRASVIAQGTIIAAVLETPLNSDRPGMARALVTQDVRGFDGSRVLIPRGSRLIGEFKPDASAGKRRVFVTWGRLIRPDGVAIRIASPATDAMGGAGVAGAVNTHAAQRLANAVLQSALSVGVNVASAAAISSGGTVLYGMPLNGSAVGQQLAPSVDRPATVKVREGTEIAVLVARDLDFAGAPVLP
jgi:type IV secretion system protein VirB10